MEYNDMNIEKKTADVHYLRIGTFFTSLDLSVRI